jgi:phosphatidylglycerophosphatase GEP4
MGQNLNISALSGLIHALIRPSLLVPCLTVPDIRHIDFAKLKQSGFKAIAFDKDNTISSNMLLI